MGHQIPEVGVGQQRVQEGFGLRVIYPPEASQKASKQATFVRAEVFNDFVEIYVVKFVHTFLNARTPASFPLLSLQCRW
jgi:predicted dienelactone hydrolase